MGKITVSTLDNFELRPGRRMGNSTRQADKAIQLLFDGYIVKVQDHWRDGNDKNCNTMLYNKIINRLNLEFQLYSKVKEGIIRVDPIKLELELLP